MMVETLLGLWLPRTVTVFAMITIPMYILFSWVLILGKLGFVPLGIAGVGWAMTLGDWLATLMLFAYVIVNHSLRPYFHRFFHSNLHLKDTHFSLLASVISFWFIALPIGYVLSFNLKLGGIGFWWGMVVGACCSVVLLSARFKSKMHAATVLPHASF